MKCKKPAKIPKTNQIIQFYYGKRWFDVRLSVSSRSYHLHFSTIEEANDFYDHYSKTTDRTYYLKNIYTDGEQYNTGVILDGYDAVTFKYWGNRHFDPNEAGYRGKPPTRERILRDRELYKQLNGKTIEVRTGKGRGGGFSRGKNWGNPDWREVRSMILQLIRNENLDSLLG